MVLLPSDHLSYPPTHNLPCPVKCAVVFFLPWSLFILLNTWSPPAFCKTNFLFFFPPPLFPHIVVSPHLLPKLRLYSGSLSGTFMLMWGSIHSLINAQSNMSYPPYGLHCEGGWTLKGNALWNWNFHPDWTKSCAALPNFEVSLVSCRERTRWSPEVPSNQNYLMIQ